jgi:(p)ppGpp synthase/HD superfamily hydrolase
VVAGRNINSAMGNKIFMARNREDDKLIEAAIKFLVESFVKSGNNPKPVILHSIRVAMHLEDLNYGRDVIIGAILHDLLEDTDVVKEEILEKFGEQIADLVEANSFRKEITNETERYIKMYDQCLRAGKDALVIKAADILDNSYYYGPNKELLEKMAYFINLSAAEIAGEKIWQELSSQHEQLTK